MEPYLFLLLLLPGFALVGASAFTAAFARRLGPAVGERATAILRSYLGMPLVAAGLVLGPRGPVLAMIVFPVMVGSGILAR